MCIWGPFTTNGRPSRLFAKPGELFSDVAAYTLENQSPRYPSQGVEFWSLEDSRYPDAQLDTMSLDLDRASLSCTL